MTVVIVCSCGSTSLALTTAGARPEGCVAALRRWRCRTVIVCSCGSTSLALTTAGARPEGCVAALRRWRCGTEGLAGASGCSRPADSVIQACG
eukprot:CAMPEP_0115499402 /NCGR_PEP_ID=MMETSP0271-20121206/67313_1 /TAXON_ID=71861 /ORGANISM="Scrippsiella trochoidea, Strain CCMP3099" /LENGTH=92 /DNA_ID=CAMNT_0002928203 /DNA_START=125 /DNA_END=403 /DNA_ORIENTATION=-